MVFFRALSKFLCFLFFSVRLVVVLVLCCIFHLVRLVVLMFFDGLRRFNVFESDGDVGVFICRCALGSVDTSCSISTWLLQKKENLRKRSKTGVSYR